ncbi:dystrotelin [Anoplopoma fimbria]|uniref:dystrotelin n=1 Tax=Anoplopoma fimbria TaxID=229290 RepID=UPI0023EE1972|nr:dystrotelin [Anoplopoma fimbria]
MMLLITEAFPLEPLLNASSLERLHQSGSIRAAPSERLHQSGLVGLVFTDEMMLMRSMIAGCVFTEVTFTRTLHVMKLLSQDWGPSVSDVIALPAADWSTDSSLRTTEGELVMDPNSFEGLNEIRPSVYRVSMKLLSLQRLSHMDVVSLRHITAALQSVGGAKLQQEVVLNRQEVTRRLNRMFHSVSQEVPGHVTGEAPEEICSLMFRLNDRNQSGFISTASLQTSLIALSAETLLVKYRALVSVAENCSGSVSRSGLRSLLQDLSQVPAAVQEEVFCGVEAAVSSCFNGVFTPTASEQHVLSWLQSEPHLLLWLPTLYRLSVSQNVSHTVRCHTCKTLPITGLRYRCMKCVNVHLCQSCFLTDRQTRKHKPHHPVLEFCTQPTWRESLSSLVRSARQALLPRRYTRREDNSRRVLMWAEPGETQDSAPPPCNASTRLAASTVSHSSSSDKDGANDASGQPPPSSSSSSSSKALHTDEETQQLKTSVLLTEVRNLQRDKWLMEQELQVWRLTVQSEQGILEDRCSEMEVTMETLREHNLRLQRSLTQALNKMEVQQHANNMPQNVDTEDSEDKDDMEDTEDSEDTADKQETEDTEDTEDREDTEDKEDTEERDDTEDMEDTEDGEDTEERDDKKEDEWSEEELQTLSPTMHQDTPLSHDIHYEEDTAGDWLLFHPMGQQNGSEPSGPQEEDTCPSEEEDCGTCSPEEMLQENVERLKAVMETDRWRERQTGERKRAELLQAADQVGDSIRHLVDAVRTDTH